MKFRLSNDGYERIRLPSKKHGDTRVRRVIHLLVTEAFMDTGKYVVDDKRQINHIHGNKRNNQVSNLEVVTGTDNVNHARDNRLYTYDLLILAQDLKMCTVKPYRSLREVARLLKSIH